MPNLKPIFFYSLIAMSLFFAGRLLAANFVTSSVLEVRPLDDLGEFEGRMAEAKSDERYLLAARWEWSNDLKLIAGKEYRLHIASADIMHSLYIPKRVTGEAIEVLIMPGKEYILPIKAKAEGVFSIGCNEYCGLSHNKMRGLLSVEKLN